MTSTPAAGEGPNPQDVMRFEAAVQLYREGKLTLSQARRLSCLGRIEFQRRLAERQIAIYSKEDLQQDVKTLQEAGLL